MVVPEPESVNNSYDTAISLTPEFETEFYNKLEASSRQTAPDKYYVKIVDGENMNNVNELILNGNSYNANDTFGMSVGQNAFVEFNYFQVRNDGLYIALPIALFEMNNQSTIAFSNGTKNYEFEYAGHVNGNMSCAGVKSQNTNKLKMEGSGNTWTCIANPAYSAQTYVGFDLEGIDLSTNLITKKEIHKPDGTVSLSYGFSTVDGASYTGGPNGGIAYYPFGWTTSKVAEGDHGTCDYSIYSIGSGKAITLALTLIADASKFE